LRTETCFGSYEARDFERGCVVAVMSRARDVAGSRMFPFRRLMAWRRAHGLALRVHEVTERSARGRYTSLVNQLRRASASVAANIAEGSGQVTAAQFARYLSIALGSARELDYHLLLAHDLGLYPSSEYARLDARCDEVCRMLNVLRARVLQNGERRWIADSSARRRSTSDLRSQVSRPVNLPHPPSD
jgi:four helix bundle protein